LIFGCLGEEEARRFVKTCERRGVYDLEEEQLSQLQQGMFASVVSERRTARRIASVYSGKGYLMGPETAMAYGGLQDYRATAGEGRLALIMAQRRPKDDLETVAAAIGIEPPALKAQLD
jgi:threonine synthase